MLPGWFSKVMPLAFAFRQSLCCRNRVSLSLKTQFSFLSFGAGIFWQSELCKNVHHFHVAIQTPNEPIESISQSAVKPANQSLSIKTAQPKMEQLCFQLTAGANYSNFALGDAIHCRHWDRSGSLKVRDPLTNPTV